LSSSFSATRGDRLPPGRCEDARVLASVTDDTEDVIRRRTGKPTTCCVTRIGADERDARCVSPTGRHEEAHARVKLEGPRIPSPVPDHVEVGDVITATSERAMLAHSVLLVKLPMTWRETELGLFEKSWMHTPPLHGASARASSCGPFSLERIICAGRHQGDKFRDILCP